MAPDTACRGAAFVALALLTAACAKAPQQAPPPPVEVGVVSVERKAAPIEFDYMARTAGVREVEVRARVSGILQRRLYTEGSAVKEGDLLFQIDPAPYVAEMERARAQVAVEEARATDARQQKERADPLVAQGVVSKRDYDTTVAAAQSTHATLEAAKAALRKAQLDLNYTHVRAPISGMTSREARSEGSLVSAGEDSALLTRISQIDQLYVQFSMPVSEAERVRSALQRQEPVQVVVSSADGRDLQRNARLEFVDTLVDPTSGTVQARATLANDGGVNLFPGQFLRARITGISLPNAIVIPTRAVLRSPMGASVWVVDAQNKAAPRPVMLGSTFGNNIVISAGLRSGETVIVDGILKVQQPGTAIRPVPSSADSPAPQVQTPSAAR